MLKIIICGINGKMGSFVYDSAIKHGHAVVCGIDNTILGKTDCPVYKSFEEVKDLADAIVDFSSPTALDSVLTFAVDNKLPLVIGTTGYSQKQESQILASSRQIPIFKSANMSLGINLILKLCALATKSLKDFEVEIIDKHHKYKKDSPSGTTNLILKSISENSSSPLTPIYGRIGEGKRKNNEVGVHSIRGGEIVGEHEVHFFGENESITISHNAYSKELFAYGSIKACEFIVDKKIGLFDMNDIIN